MIALNLAAGCAFNLSFATPTQTGKNVNISEITPTIEASAEPTDLAVQVAPTLRASPTPVSIEGIFYYLDRLSNEQQDCVDFIRLYSDGFAVEQDSCDQQGHSVSEAWRRLREYMHRWEGFAMGPWVGGYSLKGNKISLSFLRIRSINPGGEEVKVYEGTYAADSLILEGNTYVRCGDECKDPIP